MDPRAIERIKDTPMFFIVGRPRTGSTLLRTLLDAHPNVCIPQEWPMLLALHRQFGKVKNWDEPTLISFYDALFQKLRIPYWEITNWPAFDAAALKEAVLSCKGEHSFETVFKLVYSQYKSYFPKQEILLFGDKNPVYSNQVELLARAFPKAKFIHLTRDYRDNLASLLEVDFEMPNVTVLAYRWKYSFKVIESVAKGNSDRFLTIRYEDLAADAPGHFRDLCSFLGIPFDASIFEFHKRKDEILKTFPKEIVERYFKTLFNPIDTSRVGIYKRKLSGRQIRISELVTGSAGIAAGYTPDSNGFSPGLFLWTLPAVLYAKGLYAIGWLVTLLPYKTMMWLLNKPSILVKIYSGLFRKK